jgi:polysaccharide biosynthesis transport protein
MYAVEGKLRFEKSTPVSTITDSSRELANSQPIADKSNPLSTEAEVIRSQPIVRKTIDTLQLRDTDGKPQRPEQFLKQLRVAEVRQADILSINYTDSDPARAVEVINTLMQIYLDYNVQSHRTQAIATRQFIEQQLPKAEQTVKQAEGRLSDFKQEHQIVALPEESKVIVESAAQLQQQLTAVKAQIGDATAKANLYEDQLGMSPQQAKEQVALSQSPGMQDVQAQVQQLETELANQRTLLTANHPRIVNLENRLSNLKSLLNQRAAQILDRTPTDVSRQTLFGELQQDLTKSVIELNGQRQGLTQQLATLSQAEAAQKNRATLLPKLEKEQRELERQLQAAQSTYTQLLQKVGEVRIAENQTIGNARILATAQLPDRAISNASTLLAIALLSILAGGLTAYALETSDQTIKTIEQAKQVFGYTLLGVIPDDRSIRQQLDDRSSYHPIIVEQAPSSLVGSAYRILQTNIKFSSSRALQVIVISSSVAGEGKSTVAANLSAAIAQSGKRVLLIDADLQHPVQHQFWNLSNEVGLSHLLIEEAAVRKAAKCVTTNLDVLTAGVVPPSTLALLDSERMSHLIAQFAQDYDLIVLDTPPLNVATDALILGKMATGIVMVTRLELVKLGNASFAKSLLKQSEQIVLGQVINGVVIKNEPHSQYYFADTLSNTVLEKTSSDDRR